MPSLIGNGKLNMDTLDSPTAAHGYLQPRLGELNSSKGSVSVGSAGCCIEKTRHNRDHISSVPAVG
jgi:hypothetical protein